MSILKCCNHVVYSSYSPELLIARESRRISAMTLINLEGRETTSFIYQSTRRNTADDVTVHSDCSASLKSLSVS